MMASNMSESDESGNDVDDEEEVIVPRPYNTGFCMSDPWIS
jgi:hypothetical protein